MRTLILLLLMGCPALGQEESVAQLIMPDGTGSCVSVQMERKAEGGYIGIMATAWHCIVDKQENEHTSFKIVFQDGTSCSNCYVIRSSRELDVALIRSFCPDSCPPAKISKKFTRDHPMRIIGFPGGSLEQLKGRMLRRLPPYNISDCNCRFGYSGGGAFSDGELTGIISGGWFKFQESDGPVLVWPLKCCDSLSLLKFLKPGTPISDSPSR